MNRTPKKKRKNMKLLKTLYNDYDVTNLPNPYYQEVRLMNTNELEILSEQIRLKLLENWTTKKQPLGGGKKSDEQIIKDFQGLTKLDVNTIVTDKTILKYFGKLPSGLNQYFPEMLDTKISVGKKNVSVLDVIKTKETFYKFFYSVVYTDRMYNFTNWFSETLIPQETHEFLGNVIPFYFQNGYKLPFFYKKTDETYYKLNQKTLLYEPSSMKEYEKTKLFPQITQSFRLGGGSQPVSNFSGGIGKFIFLKGFITSLKNNTINNDFYVVLDTSTGWGGRLLGLLSCYDEIRLLYLKTTGRQLKVVYLTTDPNLEINNRYNDIIDDWFNVVNPDSDRRYFKMLKDTTGSETIEFYNFCKNYLDKMKVPGCNIGLTSPPYFNRERYSDDPGQSFVKYGTTYTDWSNNFLKPTINNIERLLCPDGIFFMNISNLKDGSKVLPLEVDTIRYGIDCGLKCSLDKKLKMVMSTMTGNNKNKTTGGQPMNNVEIDGKSFKYEPIFIMKKERSNGMSNKERFDNYLEDDTKQFSKTFIPYPEIQEKETDLILTNTRVEMYEYNNIPYYVKREDLSCPEPGPTFSKVRGLYPVLKKLKEQGITIVGYMETSISMAGWGISYFCQHLGMTSVIYYPKYKSGYKHNQSKFIPIWESFGSIVIPLEKPNLQKINQNKARTLFNRDFPGGHWLPQGLGFDETISEVTKEVKLTLQQIQPKTIVCNIGSGIMTSGIMCGVSEMKYKLDKLYAVTADLGTNIVNKKNKVLKLSLLDDDGTLEIISTKYKYEQTPSIETPFPCNPYYDLKAFEYMIENIENLEKPVLFWNIGS